MLEQLSKIYAEVAERVIAELPSNWKALWIRAECKASTWTTSSWYEARDVEEIINFKEPDEANELIHDAWKISQEHNDRWSSMVFNVVAPGELHIAFGHEDLDDESITINDRMNDFEEKTFQSRKVVSIVDMSGAFSLTPDMLKSGTFGPNP